MALSAHPFLTFRSSDRQSIRERLAQNVRRLREIECEIAQDKALLAPIGVIPKEVLALILAYYMQNCSFRAENRLAPLSVCRLWRETAISCSQYWTNVDDFIDGDDRDDVKRSGTELLIQLIRANDLAVDFSLFGNGLSFPSELCWKMLYPMCTQNRQVGWPISSTI